MWGEVIIRWTARLAVSCYVARVLCDATDVPGRPMQRQARWWWTVGCGIFLVHVIAAFHFEHHWNHTSAFDYTAKRTAEMTGWNSGVGLYVNEVFLALWVADTAIWWLNPNWPQNRFAYWTVQGIFAFLMFQATAVFGPIFWKPVAAIAIVCLIWLRARRCKSSG